MNTEIMPSSSNEVHIRVSRDDDAARISAVLEALGYTVLRELGEGDGPARLRWAVTRLVSAHKLTEREQDILELVLQGRNNLQIGGDLSISRATVKWHMHNIFAKTSTGNRESLLRLALQLGGNQMLGGTNTVLPAPSSMMRVPTSATIQSSTIKTASTGTWTSPEDITTRIDFEQRIVPSADSVPSKRYV